MRITLLPAALAAAFLAGRAPGDVPQAPAPRPAGGRFAPYSPDPDHPWNRLHRALFVREAADGTRHAHTTDPHLYHGGKFLLEGEPHRRAVALLDKFATESDDPLKRLFLQRDLWATFDYVA